MEWVKVEWYRGCGGVWIGTRKKMLDVMGETEEEEKSSDGRRMWQGKI